MSHNIKHLLKMQIYYKCREDLTTVHDFYAYIEL